MVEYQPELGIAVAGVHLAVEFHAVRIYRSRGRFGCLYRLSLHLRLSRNDNGRGILQCCQYLRQKPGHLSVGLFGFLRRKRF